MLPPEPESHLASTIKLPPGQATHTPAQGPHGVQAETKIAGGESFPSAVWSQESSAHRACRAVKAHVRFLTRSTSQLGLASLCVM